MKEKVCVIGLGYVGLPLACLCAKKGFDVLGYDLKKDIVDKTNKGICHIKDKNLKKALKDAKGLRATIDPKELAQCTTYIVCVPTPVNDQKTPDMSPLEGASKLISTYLKKADLVIIESTVFPGTCEEIVKPILEKTGLVAGKDFHLAHCPERVNPGDVFWTTENIPRVVGAMSAQGTERAAKFYQKLLGGPIYDVSNIKNALRPKIVPIDGSYKLNTVPLGTITKMNSIKDAEAVKAMENTVRDVNIAFVNELAKISDVLNLDVVDIIEGMATKPFGKGPFYPGIGVGGHCIAVDPEWLKAASIKAGFFPKLIQISRDTNNSMPEYAISIVEKNMNKKSKVAVLGVTYKGNIDDPRESPYYEIKKILINKKLIFDVYDPWYEKENTVSSIEKCLSEKDILLLVTDHGIFKEKLTAGYLKSTGIKVVVDGRNCLDADKIKAAGIKYKGIGR
ncbi:MAG: nucleotide sugar dehydrogenase [archaeon]